MDKEYWNRFYEKPSVRAFPSNFANFVSGFFSERGTLIEFGCGNGVDSKFFSEQGWDVFASDVSLRGLEVASAVAPESADSSILRFDEVDVGTSSINTYLDQMKLDTAEKKPVVIYSRFFLHSLDESEFENFIVTSGKLGSSFYHAHEFRVPADEERWKTFSDHRRVFRKVEDVRDRLLMQFEGRVLLEIESAGLAVFGDEDPIVGRLIIDGRSAR